MKFTIFRSLCVIPNLHDGVEFQFIGECLSPPEAQAEVHLRLSWGSAHVSYCSISTELSWLTWALLYVPIMCMHRWARPKVSPRWQDLRLNTRTQNDWKYRLRKNTKNFKTRRRVSNLSSSSSESSACSSSLMILLLSPGAPGGR